MKIFLSGIEHGGPATAMKIMLSAVEQGAQSDFLRKYLASPEEKDETVKIFLSATETADEKKQGIEAVYKKKQLLWNLMSYYYLRSDIPFAEKIKEHSQLVMIDSGAHSFQKGTKVDWDRYTAEYAEFIKAFDDDKVVGYFEMDVDNILGYPKVLQLRRQLERVSDKIIPVWHRYRGIDEYKRMCEEYAGKVVAITGFKNEDIKDEQYPLFLKEAKKHGCKVHCLGMTRKAILDTVPFDYVDSSSWAMHSIYGRAGGVKVTREFSKNHREKVFEASYLQAMKMQQHYYLKWRKVCKD